MSAHEVYAHAPLALVTAQVQFAYEPLLNDSGARDQFAAKVRGRLPVLKDETVGEAFIEIGPDQPSVQQVTQHRQIRATNSASTVSVALWNRAITIEATEYKHFEGFAETLGQCLTALIETVGSIHVSRAGLRYIDEVRVPGITATADWSGWVDDALVSAARLLPKRDAGGVSGVTAYQLADEMNLVFRWGEIQGTTVIAENAAVRRPAPPTGRFFVLDADAFWQPRTPQATDIDSLLGRFSLLHEPLSEVFEASLTDKVRDLFRGEEEESG